MRIRYKGAYNVRLPIKLGTVTPLYIHNVSLNTPPRCSIVFGTSNSPTEVKRFELSSSVIKSGVLDEWELHLMAKPMRVAAHG